MATNILEIQHLDKYYGKNQVLRSLSFSLRNGECCTLFGVNGAGKSTLIKIISGLEKITSGRIRILSHDLITERHQALKKLGVMPQDFNLNLTLTVRQILILNCMYLGNSYKKSKMKADEIIDLLDLFAYINEKTDNLSSGRKRSLMLGRALIGSPKLLILDEPTAGIDFSIKTRIFDHLRLLKKKGISILLVTHVIDDIEKVSDTIAVLKKGRIDFHTPLSKIQLTSLKRVYKLNVDNTAKLLSHDSLSKNYNVIDKHFLEITTTDVSNTLDSNLKILANVGVHILDIERVASPLEELLMDSYKC